MPLCQECGRQVEPDELVAGPPAPPGAGTSAPDDDVAGTGVQDAEVDGSGASDPEYRDRCPSCGAVVEDEDEGDEGDARPKAPWHFKVLVVGTAVYLAYRVYQGIGWLVHHG